LGGLSAFKLGNWVWTFGANIAAETLLYSPGVLYVVSQGWQVVHKLVASTHQTVHPKVFQQSFVNKEDWLVVWNMAFIFPYTVGIIIPTDELHDFSEG
jgi:hypothetical protein